MRWLMLSILVIGALFLGAGRTWADAREHAGDGEIVDAQVEQLDLPVPPTCSDRFVTHKLDFATGTRLREISTYVSNGAGVAVGDLDDDGDLDLVFASVDRESVILWNQGDLTFERQTLDDRLTRGVAIVDVDGDGLLDITFTHRDLAPPTWWRNLGSEAGRPTFALQPLTGVDGYAYTMAWGDLNRDGQLDLVTGSYGAELKQHGIAVPAEDERAGLFVYLQEDGVFAPQRLSSDAETLAIGLIDLEDDGKHEIWVANDFALRDQLWRMNDGRWIDSTPFRRTSHSTMSLDWGDVTGGGVESYFTTDMKPYDASPAVMAQWAPVMEHMGEHHESGDPQVMANVLQMPARSGRWHEQATRRGVDASGWSWAARLGDLDSDGALDIYVVNGMIAADMFGHLPDGELVEENQAYRNRGSGVFDRAPEWKLNSTASGRGMVMADLDDDGDLDIIVNNLRKPAELHENQLCGGDALQVTLRWPDSGNSRAIGAAIRLYTTSGVQVRDIRASGGYLSGDAALAHFGVAEGEAIEALEIVWPDGAVTYIDEPKPASRVIVTR